MSLKARLVAEICSGGPLTVAQFMTRCLHDPEDGYYAVRPALGEGGDFITAPLVSQMFGELLGLWAVEAWRRLGSPSPFILAEAGPGDGTLMGDALRAARLDPAFIAAARLHLVETSAPLRATQDRALAQAPLVPAWADSVDAMPAGGPLILLANELLDCLPARQFVRLPGGWAERVVGADEAGDLVFGLAPAPSGALPPEAPKGAVFELSPAQAAFGEALGRRLALTGGAALLIDYGRAEPGFGDTLQALTRHQRQNPLQAPGQADLTVHVDFPAVAEAARGAGAQTAPIVTQAAFLRRLGIEARAAALATARPDREPVIARQLDRLVGEDQMGVLFKVLAVYAPLSFMPPGFEDIADVA